MSPTMRTFLPAVSEGSDTGMLVAADALDESGNPDDTKLAELLRMYVNGQTMIRMSQIPPTAFGRRFAELNAYFKLPSVQTITDSWYAKYRKPLGPYYLGCEVDQMFLGTHLHLLSDQPIRELEISNCRPSDPDFAIILRNYRMDTMFHLTLYLRHTAQAGDIDQLSRAIKDLKGSMLQRLTITGLDDRKKMIAVHFMMGRGIASGCELWINQRAYGEARLILTKK